MMKCIFPRKKGKLSNMNPSSRPPDRLRLKGLSVGLIVLSAAVVLSGGTLYGQGGDDPLFIDSNGKVMIQDLEVKNLDVKNRVNTGEVKATGTVEADKFKGDGSSLRIEGGGALKEALERKLDKAGGKLEGPLDVNGSLNITGGVRARTFEATNPMRHRMYPDDPVVYQDIFEAREKGIIVKLGNPQSYNETSFSRTNPWNGRPIILYGGRSEKDGNGAQIHVPSGYDTAWVRVCGERWNVIHAYSLDPGGKDLGFWAGGRRFGNSYGPDGSLGDSYHDAHQWVPIPVRGVSSLALISNPSPWYNPKAGDGDMWLSGLAFSKNPWAHAAQSALGYHWAINGGDRVEWEADSYQGDVLARIVKNAKWVLKVPVVPSGRDKLLYVITHGSEWNDCTHSGITVNGQKIERLLATYDNPFARHWNSKAYARYIAARVPAGLIPPDARHLDVQIDMSRQNGPIKFREIGTHDLEIPWDY